MEKIKTFTIKFWAPIILFLLVIPTIFPLLRTGFFTMHDDQQIVRLYEMDQALAVGQFPVRWVKDLGFGYGYPLFIFYPPLVYYAGEVFHLWLATGYIDSMKLVFGIALIGAAVSMYLWAKEHFGKRPAIFAAIFYAYAPYHAVDAYVRGALAELFTFVWLPLILLSTDRLIFKSKKYYWIWLGLFLALLMITHNLIFLPFFPLFLIYSGFSLLNSKNKLHHIQNIVYAIVLSFGLSAFFWIPALAEKQFTLVDTILLSDLASYEVHFVEPAQLWNSLWGYGGSTLGPLDGFSLKIGKVHILFSLLAILVALFSKYRKGKEIDLHNKPVLISIVLFFFSAFMTTAYSKPIWEVFSPLQFLQFPWRFLTFTALFSSFLASVVMYGIGKITKISTLTVVFVIVIVGVIIIPNVKYFQPQRYLKVSDAYYTNDEFTKWTISKTSFEFVPKEVETTKQFNLVENQEITQVNINEYQISRAPYEVIAGEADVKVIENSASKIKIQINTSQGSKIKVNTYDFPGWLVEIDGKITSFETDNPLHLIEVNIPQGNHMLSLTFKETKVRKMGNLISLLSGVMVLYMLYKIRIAKVVLN